MKVKRSSDGGLLGPYAPATTCNCEYEAVATQTSPAACTACASSSMLRRPFDLSTRLLRMKRMATRDLFRGIRSR